ncbi:WhiB family transcriptional regulator [Rhodococcus sp. TAF43]|uniref:WhiB family transcriptional regulator n=1 Tax=Rhodococcus sp. TAF43 TaxID=3237483 RepID=UPI003F9D5343
MSNRSGPVSNFESGPVLPRGHGEEEVGAGVSICMTCPVLTPCRSHALHGPERFGIWGGTTPTERARL